MSSSTNFGSNSELEQVVYDAACFRASGDFDGLVRYIGDLIKLHEEVGFRPTRQDKAAGEADLAFIMSQYSPGLDVYVDSAVDAIEL